MMEWRTPHATLCAATLASDLNNTNIMRWKFFTPDEDPEEDRCAPQ